MGLLRRGHITHSLRSLVYDPENLTTNLDAPEIQVLIVVRQVNDRIQCFDSPSLFRSSGSLLRVPSRNSAHSH